VLIDDWERHDRAAAANIATQNSVQLLFESAYAGEPLNDRGCSTSFQIICSWGPYGGANPADPLIQVYLGQAGTGFYVSDVVVES
jgi:hypothetical protein